VRTFCVGPLFVSLFSTTTFFSQILPRASLILLFVRCEPFLAGRRIFELKPSPMLLSIFLPSPAQKTHTRLEFLSPPLLTVRKAQFKSTRWCGVSSPRCRFLGSAFSPVERPIPLARVFLTAPTPYRSDLPGLRHLFLRLGETQLENQSPGTPPTNASDRSPHFVHCRPRKFRSIKACQTGPLCEGRPPKPVPAPFAKASQRSVPFAPLMPALLEALNRKPNPSPRPPHL